MKIRSISAITLTAVLACAPKSEAPSRSTDSATVKTWMAGGTVDTALTRALTGAGVIVDYPADANVVDDLDKNGVWGFGGRLIQGPVVRREFPNTGRTDGHAYYLMVSTLSTSTATLDDWVDSLRHDWNDHDFDEDSLSFLRPASATTIAGIEVRLLSPFCGDCLISHYAMKRGRMIVVFTMINGGLEAWSRDSAEMISERIMGTVRWAPEH